MAQKVDLNQDLRHITNNLGSIEKACQTADRNSIKRAIDILESTTNSLNSHLQHQKLTSVDVNVEKELKATIQRIQQTKTLEQVLGPFLSQFQQIMNRINGMVSRFGEEKKGRVGSSEPGGMQKR